MAVIKVKLRQKSILNNKKSLYLDFYPPIPHPETGEPTRRRFLNLSIFGSLEKGKLDKITHNKLKPLDQTHDTNTYNIAEGIRQKFEHELNQNEALSNAEKNFIQREKKAQINEAKELLKGEENFVTYFKTIAEKRESSNLANWNSTYKYLFNFTYGILKFADLNEQFCNDFKNHLLTTNSNKSKDAKLSQNTAASYFIKFKIALRQAYKEGILKHDLNFKIDAIKTVETHRNYLTIEEVNQLVKTDCKNEILKRAALFSALTGLRNSDILKLTWSEIEYINGNGYFVKFTQQKTKSIEMMPINEQAYSYLGEAKELIAKVFEGLEYSAKQNKILQDWIDKAKINKKITFHCFRHTFATLQLSNGTDIFTVSKMLGHKELKTTQIYAKIIDKTKREAANAIKLDYLKK